MNIPSDWSTIPIENDEAALSPHDLAALPSARICSLSDVFERLVCPDTHIPLKRTHAGALALPDDTPLDMRGARPVLLPQFARSRIQGANYVFEPTALRAPGLQYLYLGDVKAHGGDQNSSFEDIWYHRHIYRTRELTRDASGSLLDIGCDTPSVSSRQFPAGVDYIGLEPSLTTSDEFCICAMAEFLPIRDDSFDNVALMTSLDHMLDDHQAIDEAFRVLRPGGSLYLASLIWTDKASLIGDTVHFHHFRDWEIQGLLRKFTIERVQRYGWKNNDHRFGIYLKARKSAA